MPDVLMFVACDQIIADQERGTISVIEILESAEIGAPPNLPIPYDATVPNEWVVAVMLRRTEAEAQKAYQLRVQMIAPDGKVRLDVNTSMPPGSVHHIHRDVVRIKGFPVGPSGIHTLQLAIRPADTNKDWVILTQYPLEITLQVRD